MDGNGRWAKKRGMPRSLGHRKGAETLKDITRYCESIGIKYLTVYAFSTENWKRPKEEVSNIILLLKDYVQSFENMRDSDRVILQFIGNTDFMDDDLNREYEEISRKSKQKKNAITLSIAFNYGGRDEIIRAARKSAQLIQSDAISLTELNEELFSSLLDTGNMPPPDLLIRTGGEQRISNFLLWQLAYAEMWFTDVLWPDMQGKDIDEAIVAFQMRQRKFGGVIDENQNN